MLSGILNSRITVKVNIAIMRAFVKLREMIAFNKDLSKRLDVLEKKYDSQFRVVFGHPRSHDSAGKEKAADWF